jgi:kumamolisin
MASTHFRMRRHLPLSTKPLPQGTQQVGSTDANEIVSVTVILKRKQSLDLADLRGRILTRGSYERRYGADPAAIEHIRAFAAEQGLAIDENSFSPLRRSVTLRGTAASMQQAFSVQLKDVVHEGRRYRSCEGPLSMPNAHADYVVAVLGLDLRPQAKPHFRRLSQTAAASAASTSYTPRQVAQIYDFPLDADGSGQTIGLIELGGGFTTTDIQQYFQQQGLPIPNVLAVSVDGGANAPGDPNGADGEVMLDIEVVASIAPAATIVVYFAPNTDQGFLDALTTAIHDTTHNPSVISISWGGPESSWSTQAITAMDDACQSAGALGVSITVASGDNGSSDGANGGNHVDFPASSPHVLGCGGTALEAKSGKVSKETVWNDSATNDGATGGGISAVFTLPSWQDNSSVPTGTGAGGRGVPDVAGDAAPQTGYRVQVDGQQAVIGGTSAVAPLWAGLIALLNQKLGKPLGFINPRLYAGVGTGFRDITSGNNGAFAAGPGWDACTGLGVPDGQKLLAALQLPAPKPVKKKKKRG